MVPRTRLEQQSNKRIRLIPTSSVHDDDNYYVQVNGGGIKINDKYKHLNTNNLELIIKQSLKMMSITSIIPEDPLKNILSFIPITEYIVMSIICKQFKKICYEPNVYKYFKLRIDNRYHTEVPLGVVLFPSTMPIITLSSCVIYSNWSERLKYIQYLFLYIHSPKQIDIYCDIFGRNHSNLQYLSLQCNFIDDTNKISKLLNSFQSFSTLELLLGDKQSLNYYHNYQSSMNDTNDMSNIPTFSSSDFGKNQADSLRFLQLIGGAIKPNVHDFTFTSLLGLSLTQLYFADGNDINILLSKLKSLIYLQLIDTTWSSSNGKSVYIPPNILCLGCVNIGKSPINFKDNKLIFLSYDEIPDINHIELFFCSLNQYKLNELKEFLWYSYPDDAGNEKVAPQLFQYLSLNAPQLKYITLPRDKCCQSTSYFEKIAYQVIPKYFNNSVQVRDRLQIPVYTSLFPVIPYLYTIFSASETRLKQINQLTFK